MAVIETETFDTSNPMSEVEARGCVNRINHNLNSIRYDLLDLYERDGWRALGYSSWRDCVTSEFNYNQAYIYRLFDAAQIERNFKEDYKVSPIGETEEPIPESQLRPLSKLKTPEEQREAWEEANEKAKSDERKVTAKDVQEAVERKKNPSQFIVQSNEVEWYTPEEYIESARRVLGVFDLDPASSAIANKTVKATHFFSREKDGLSRVWAGKIWLNPPYGKECREFVEKLIKEYELGNVREAILLVNSNSTDTSWFQPLWDHTLCFTNHRINFYQSGGDQRSGSTHGSVFVYFGPHVHVFLEEFSQFGVVVRRLL